MTDSAVRTIDTPTADDPATTAAANQAPATNLREVRVEDIAISAERNPRKKFDDADIAAFAERIRESGWLSPPLVRPNPDGPGYLLVAGERRMRAVQLLGWTHVQVTVKDMDEVEHRRLALAENVDRRDLTIAEEALAARDHINAYDDDYEAAARALGWSVTKLRHRLKLLLASPAVIDALMQGSIQLGHAELLTALPVENQDKALPRIIEQGITVAQLREQINGFASPLASAIFDTSACASCPFNTSCQGTLFEARVSEGNCTNKSCFNEKTSEAIAAKREQMKAEFGTVVLVSQMDASQSVPLLRSGPTGVGAVQFDACKSCQFRAAAIHDAQGLKLGTVEGPLCMNTACHSQRVAEYQASIAPPPAAPSTTDQGNAPVTRTPPPAKPGKSGKAVTVAKPRAVLRTVQDQYAAIAARAGEAALAVNDTPALAAALYLTVRNAHIEANGVDANAICTALGLPDKDDGSDSAYLAALAEQDAAKLVEAMKAIGRAILTCALTNKPSTAHVNRLGLLPILAARTGIDVAAHVVVDRAYLEAHTKAAIEVLLQESGFKAWMEQQDDGATKYRRLVAGKKEEVIAGVLASGYTFPGYVPSGYAEQVEAWRKEARIERRTTAQGVAEAPGEPVPTLAVDTVPASGPHSDTGPAAGRAVEAVAQDEEPEFAL